MKKILLFGGTFDPFHNGHYKMLERTIEKIKFEKVIIIPNYIPINKKKPKYTALARYQMLLNSIKELPQKKGLEIEISDYEINQKKTCYTIDTINTFKKKYKEYEFVLLIGSDNFFNFHHWKRFDEILKETSICVVSRNSHSLTEYETYLKNYCDTIFYKSIIILNKNPIEISSTLLRDRQSNANFLKDNIPSFIYNQLKHYD